MEQVKFNNKMQELFKRYKASSDYSLNDIYKSFSSYKQNAYNDCVKLMDKHNGDTLRIIGYNSSVFSVGFMFTNEQKQKCFAYITHTANKFCIID